VDCVLKDPQNPERYLVEENESAHQDNPYSLYVEFSGLPTTSGVDVSYVSPQLEWTWEEDSRFCHDFCEKTLSEQQVSIVIQD
jgi:hypothetical protein